MAGYGPKVGKDEKAFEGREVTQEEFLSQAGSCTPRRKFSVVTRRHTYEMGR